MSDAADVRTCESVCPAGAVKLHSGSDIDSATTEAGGSYKALADAFRIPARDRGAMRVRRRRGHRTVADCDADTMTLRTGDIIAADDGFKIAAIFGGQKRSVLCRLCRTHRRSGFRASGRDRHDHER
ncbi:DUF2865 domain-containing protein [Bradyrhizobium sp. Ce-3]|uniref:DUF2865 domain-containing protein n=1 Tax=Bradyrhizobium sp. Ce-3 TaxID=2913970 RepID=UPI001FC8263B|nr:DUF2865 domain-containing protein [Bradyrhizobium sp. Ce-3]